MRWPSAVTATYIGGAGTATCFSEDLEPALVFGRSARQSLRITSYGVHPAAEEVASKPGEKTAASSTPSPPSSSTGAMTSGSTSSPGANACDPASARWPPTPRHLTVRRPEVRGRQGNRRPGGGSGPVADAPRHAEIVRSLGASVRTAYELAGTTG